MNIALCYRLDVRNSSAVECYPRSFQRVLESKGHNVVTAGEGHGFTTLENLKEKDFDLLIEIENGRNASGELVFQQSNYRWSIPSVVWLIDSHGHPNLHKFVSSAYTYVFFAVWIQRDLFKEHKNAFWLPNSTDLQFFDRSLFTNSQLQYDFGFHGSRMGLARADKLVQICQKRNWNYDVREVTKPRKQKWPAMGNAMSCCSNLYNWGSHRDGPNQRVFESMAVGRPLLSDLAPDDGMHKLFEDGKHFIGYQRDWSDLEEKMEWCIQNPAKTITIAENGYNEVATTHTIQHRVDNIFETIKL